MRKGIYYFKETGRIHNLLLVSGIIFISMSIILFILTRDIIYVSHNATISELLYLPLSVPFLKLGLFFLFIDYCINKICTDTSRLLKDIEYRYDKKFEHMAK